MPRRKSELTLQPGSSIYLENEHYVILQILDLNYILAQNLKSEEIQKLRITDVHSYPKDKIQTLKSNLIEVLPDTDWQIAQQKFEIIRPLLHKPERSTADVRSVAESHDVHMTTVYKWLRQYESDGLLTGLSPKKRSDAGTKKLDDKVEVIIQSCIEEEYLTSQRKKVSSVYETIRIQCRNAGLSPPHANTVRNRIRDISERLQMSKRFGRKKADNTFELTKGKFPHADYPLAVIQIDHTPVDLILVDDEHRLPTQRPWITVAIDVYSRMIVGFYVSLDPPSATSVGVCLANSILPKDKWLAEHNIASEWPCWGIPRTVHADNAKEFRGTMLQRASEEYGFSIEWRPVARSNFGGHIERLLGTLSNQIHSLPGTTFSNTKQREGYDSDKKSSMTLSEFERWLGILITEKYHHSFHTGIQGSPLSRYEQGILGTTTSKGVGLPRRIQDEETLRINFLPYEERTVQSYGIIIDQIEYFHDVLRVWVNAKDGRNPKLKRKFICRRDPRNISVIWFFDPQIKTYFPIPYRNTSFPAISLWELRKAQKELKTSGIHNINEEMIFNAIEKMREIELNSVTTTKSARKSQQRRKSGRLKSKKTASPTPHIDKPQENYPSTASENNEPIAEGEENILPFDEVEEYGSDA